MQGFRAIFADIPDPRDFNAQHDLTEILFIALAASLCGADSCVGFAEFGRAKEPLLREFLALEHGIPSHDTFTRVLRHLDPQPLEAALIRFVAVLGQALGQPPAGNGPAPKVQAPIGSLRVEELGAEGNQLVLRISGVVAPGGIVIVAP